MNGLGIPPNTSAVISFNNTCPTLSGLSTFHYVAMTNVSVSSTFVQFNASIPASGLPIGQYLVCLQYVPSTDYIQATSSSLFVRCVSPILHLDAISSIPCVASITSFSPLIVEHDTANVTVTVSGSFLDSSSQLVVVQPGSVCSSAATNSSVVLSSVTQSPDRTRLVITIGNSGLVPGMYSVCFQVNALSPFVAVGPHQLACPVATSFSPTVLLPFTPSQTVTVTGVSLNAAILSVVFEPLGCQSAITPSPGAVIVSGVPSLLAAGSQWTATIGGTGLPSAVYTVCVQYSPALFFEAVGGLVYAGLCVCRLCFCVSFTFCMHPLQRVYHHFPLRVWISALPQC